jgi:hypothetical protein
MRGTLLALIKVISSLLRCGGFVVQDDRHSARVVDRTLSNICGLLSTDHLIALVSDLSGPEVLIRIKRWVRRSL